VAGAIGSGASGAGFDASEGRVAEGRVGEDLSAGFLVVVRSGEDPSADDAAAGFLVEGRFDGFRSPVRPRSAFRLRLSGPLAAPAFSRGSPTSTAATAGGCDGSRNPLSTTVATALKIAAIVSRATVS
jgi:hypothetical protein